VFGDAEMDRTINVQKLVDCERKKYDAPHMKITKLRNAGEFLPK
jgi:hypothetical protein